MGKNMIERYLLEGVKTMKKNTKRTPMRIVAIAITLLMLLGTGGVYAAEIPVDPDPPNFTTSINIPLVNGNAPALTPAKPAAAPEGTTVWLPALSANLGFTFYRWEVVSGDVKITNPNSATEASFVMQNSNVVLNAVFVPSNLTFDNQILPSGTVGIPYSANVNMPGGGSGMFTFSGTVPSGLILSPTGSIAGMPTTAMVSQTFPVTVTDTRSGATATATYTITIRRGEQTLTAPRINTVVESSPIDLAGHAVSSEGTAGGPITYSVTNTGTTGARIEGTMLSFTGPGTAIIRATAAGGANFNSTFKEFMLIVTETASASISPGSATFDLNPGRLTHRDVEVTMTTAGNEVLAVKLGDTELVMPYDYSVNGNVYVFKTEFLNTLEVGEHTITFVMSGGRNPELVLTVTETPDADPVAMPDGTGFPILPFVLSLSGAGIGLLLWSMFRHKGAA